MLIILCVLILTAALYLFLIAPGVNRKPEIAEIFGDFAHRGLHQAPEFPENSTIAFERAVDKGHGIELDVQLTKDKKAVVFHDYTLERMCNVSGRVSEMTYEQLLRFNLLDTGQKIPLFEDVLKNINGKVPLIVEIKSESADLSVCEPIYEILKQYKGTYCVESFNALVLYWFRKNAPGIILGQLSSNLTKNHPRNKLFLKYLTKHLMLNFLSRPDFIAYKYSDINNLSLRINKALFNAPTAVWVIDNIDDYHTAKSKHNMIIFERFIP